MEDEKTAAPGTAGDKPSMAALGDKPPVGMPAAGVGAGQRPQARGAPAEETIEKTRGMARQLFGDVRSAAEEMLEERKERVAEGAHGVADALRRTAGNLKGENEMIARYAEQAADTVARLTETVRERRLGDMVAELDDFARRQPALFLVGAVAAGFVAGRFMAASAEREEGAAWSERHTAERRPFASGPAAVGDGDFRTRGSA